MKRLARIPEAAWVLLALACEAAAALLVYNLTGRQ